MVAAGKPWYRIERAAAEVADVEIFDEISPWGITAKDFRHDLSLITAPVVNLHLNTPGGDVYDGIAIYNAIKDHPAVWTAYIPGLAASIGTVIAMAADKVVIAPHARMMIHEAWAFAAGDASDFAKMAERLEATSANIASIYVEKAGGADADWRALMKAETWYTDQEAVDAGLADSVGRASDGEDAVAEAARHLRQVALFDLRRYRHGVAEAARLRAELDDDPLDDPPPPEDDLLPDELRVPELLQQAIQRYESEQEALEAALSPAVRR